MSHFRLLASRLSRDRQLFYLEQWVALAIGLACLAETLWVLCHGYKPSGIGILARFDPEAVATVAWFLSSAVTFIGISLLRFAFYRPKTTEQAALSLREISSTHDAIGQGSHLLTLDAGDRRRG